MTIPKRPKRCKVCGKIIAERNKSGLCSFHLKQMRLSEYETKRN